MLCCSSLGLFIQFRPPLTTTSFSVFGDVPSLSLLSYSLYHIHAHSIQIEQSPLYNPKHYPGPKEYAAVKDPGQRLGGDLAGIKSIQRDLATFTGVNCFLRD